MQIRFSLTQDEREKRAERNQVSLICIQHHPWRFLSLSFCRVFRNSYTRGLNLTSPREKKKGAAVVSIYLLFFSPPKEKG